MIMKDVKLIGAVELSKKEMREINGGLFLEICISLFAIGYMIGKDAAERDRRLQSQK